LTSVKPAPNNYHTVTPYILVQDADKLIDFVKKAFDAKETERITMPDGSIGHAEVRRRHKRSDYIILSLLILLIIS
jgi:PhnB protein